MDKTNDNNESLVTQFCSVTGADAITGKQLLEACGGSLEVAINMYMEGDGAAMSPSSGDAEDAVRAPIPQTQEVLVDDAPSYGTFRGRKRKTRSVFDGFRDFQAEAPKGKGKKKKSQQEEELMAGASGSRTSRKTKTLQDLFRPPVDITYKGNLANAREMGRTQGKWVMVNIQNVQEFPCQALNRDVWSNTAVKTLLKDNFIFWQVYHDSEEGQRYCQFYKVDNWPYVAVLDPQTGEKMITWNKVEPLTFCDLVTEFLTQHPTTDSLSPAQAAAKRDDCVINASEDDQLQAAITASLTEVSKLKTAKKSDVVSDSDCSYSDLETFTDSESESQPSPIKSRRRSHSDSKRKSQGKNSPIQRRSPRKNSEDEGSQKEYEASSPVRRSVRCISPLAGSSACVDETQRTQRKCSPQRTVKISTDVKNMSSPRKTSPLCRTQSPQKCSSPQKSESIHNKVHPAVLENIRRNSVSEDDCVQETAVKESASKTEDCESNKAVETSTDSRDYTTYLGPDSDEKTTLLLRLPDGQRERLCIAYSTKLLALVLFVNLKGFSSERYELIAQFPRRQLSMLNVDASLRDIGLHAQETIFVQARS